MNSVAGIAIESGRSARVFIARRKPGGDLGEKWEFPGGKVEEGETDAQTLCREFLEEFDVAIEVGPHLASAEFAHKGRPFLLNAYRVNFLNQDFHLTEHTEWRWASLDEIEALDFAGSDLGLLPGLQAHLETQGGINH